MLWASNLLFYLVEKPFIKKQHYVKHIILMIYSHQDPGSEFITLRNIYDVFF